MINRAKYFQQLASSIDNSFTRIASTASELYTKEAESLANLRLSELNTQINRSVTSIVDDKSISADEMESRYNATWQDLNAIATEGITNNKAKQIIADRTALMFEDRKSNILIAATQRRADNITIAKTASIENILKGYQEQDHPEQIIEKIKGELGYVDGKLVNPIFSPAETERLVNEYTREAYMIDASLYIDVLLRADESKDGKTGYARAKEYVEDNEFGYTELEQKELGEYIESQYSDVQTIRNRETAITVDEVANLMTERLTSGASVAATWKDLEAQIELMPDYMQRQARDAAKAVHSQWATEKGIAQWNQDKNADLVDLQERRESIASGALSNSQYHNLPLVQNTMLNLYDNQIAKLESTLDSDIKNLKIEQLRETESAANLIVNSYELGDKSYEDAVGELQKLNLDIASQTDGTEDDLLISDKLVYLKKVAELNARNKDAESGNQEAEYLRGVQTEAELILSRYNEGTLTPEEAQEQLASLNDEAAQTETLEDDLLISQRVASLKEAVAKSITAQTEAEQERSEAESKAARQALEEEVKAIKNLTDGVYADVLRGNLSGNDAIAILHSIGDSTVGDLSDDVYAAEMINKIVDDIVPPVYKPGAEQMMNYLESQFFGYADREKDVDSEVQQKISAARLWAQAAVIDLFMNTPGNQMTIDSFVKGLQNIKNTYVGKSIDGLKKPYKDVTSGEIKGDNNTEVIQDAEDKNYQMGKFDSVLFDEASGKIEWANSDMKNTFDAVAGVFKQRLESEGIEITSAPTPLKVGDLYYPTPVYFGVKDGKTSMYANDRGGIYRSEDNGETWEEISRSTELNFDNRDYQERTPVNEYFDRHRTNQQEISDARVDGYKGYQWFTAPLQAEAERTSAPAVLAEKRAEGAVTAIAETAAEATEKDDLLAAKLDMISAERKDTGDHKTYYQKTITAVSDALTVMKSAGKEDTTEYQNLEKSLKIAEDNLNMLVETEAAVTAAAEAEAAQVAAAEAAAVEKQAAEAAEKAARAAVVAVAEKEAEKAAEAKEAAEKAEASRAAAAAEAASKAAVAKEAEEKAAAAVKKAESRAGGYQWITGEQKKLINEPEPEQLPIDVLKAEIEKSIENGRIIGKSDVEIILILKETFKNHANYRELFDIIESLIGVKVNKTDQSDRKTTIDSFR